MGICNERHTLHLQMPSNGIKDEYTDRDYLALLPLHLQNLRPSMKTLLIGDIGSTSADWALIQKGEIHHFTTGGFNPTANDKSVGLGMVETIEKSLPEHSIDAIHYYGTGVNGPEAIERVRACFREMSGSISVFVGSDILGAARSLFGEEVDEGVVAILGTGSNVCQFRQGEIIGRGVNLGYLLADEGSGISIGRRLLKAYYYEQLPPDLHRTLKTVIPPPEQLVPQLYAHPAPNRFIASFARHAIENRDHASIKTLVATEFQEFIHSHLLRYKSLHKIHFVGSIAFYFCDSLRDQLRAAGLTLGTVVRRPIEGLAKYHQKSQHHGR
ncbi:MAG: hypothetical protein KTR24_17765 [Saprospiraceae bacterium]|nr:hypothetical protein [Saprospiraceae bacterium]